MWVLHSIRNLNTLTWLFILGMSTVYFHLLHTVRDKGMLFLRKLLICYFKHSRHRQEETLFQASSYCFQRALIDHSQTGKFNSLSNFASFRSDSTAEHRGAHPWRCLAPLQSPQSCTAQLPPRSQGSPRTAMGNLLSSVPTSGHCTGWRSYSSQQKETLWEKARNIIC